MERFLHIKMSLLILTCDQGLKVPSDNSIQVDGDWAAAKGAYQATYLKLRPAGPRKGTPHVFPGLACLLGSPADEIHDHLHRLIRIRLVLELMRGSAHEGQCL